MILKPMAELWMLDRNLMSHLMARYVIQTVAYRRVACTQAA